MCVCVLQFLLTFALCPLFSSNFSGLHAAKLYPNAANTQSRRRSMLHVVVAIVAAIAVAVAVAAAVVAAKAAAKKSTRAINSNRGKHKISLDYKVVILFEVIRKKSLKLSLPVD